MGRLFRQLMYRQASSSAVLPLYQQILNSMPAELRASLVCWYSPNLQGITNAELYNSDNLYEGGLHDLSGNGHDMDLRGFDGVEGGGHVDEDGNLCFDGVNDYGVSGFGNDADYTEIMKFSLYDITASRYIFSHKQASKGNLLATTSGSRITFYPNGISNSNASIVYQANDIILAIADPQNFNGVSVPTSTWGAAPYLFFGKIRSSTSVFTHYKVYSYILFSRTLTDSEIDWVKTNMLVSQEPSKRNVTLWLVDEESGTFDKFKTLKIQDGNMVGKYDEEGDLVLPVYDVDATHQTSLQWYTDADCTEEYSGEYITEDTFMYTKEEPKLQ